MLARSGRGQPLSCDGDCTEDCIIDSTKLSMIACRTRRSPYAFYNRDPKNRVSQYLLDWTTGLNFGLLHGPWILCMAVGTAWSKVDDLITFQQKISLGHDHLHWFNFHCFLCTTLAPPPKISVYAKSEAFEMTASIISEMCIILHMQIKMISTTVQFLVCLSALR